MDVVNSNSPRSDLARREASVARASEFKAVEETVRFLSRMPETPRPFNQPDLDHFRELMEAVRSPGMLAALRVLYARTEVWKRFDEAVGREDHDPSVPRNVKVLKLIADGNLSPDTPEFWDSEMQWMLRHAIFTVASGIVYRLQVMKQQEITLEQLFELQFAEEKIREDVKRNYQKSGKTWDDSVDKKFNEIVRIVRDRRKRGIPTG